ncbi:division/cell wall cluster transcriptional repressor MraZ [Mycoplasma parvum]|uniref:Transcriptional regulator MraZ n=1 Tax=Mycoplasma parvum str. Indiana TaxID=1403316 RepID=U5NBZ9_9MOLU|nr:division/cell wall cluster transcriptional repressor MraZ [Mycoplasma parvum]AGX89096.1 hypothetical protein PRV_01770 [Mycoplasma parvum str. Indiana]
MEKPSLQRHFFSGTYTEYMDGRNRIAIPLVWRHILKDKAIITKGQDGCLCLWTKEFFEYYARRRIDICQLEGELEAVQRLLIGSSKTLDIDSKSRMCIPDDWLGSFDADNEMYFMGVGDYIEIWTKDLLNGWKEDQIIKQSKKRRME